MNETALKLIAFILSLFITPVVITFCLGAILFVTDGIGEATYQSRKITKFINQHEDIINYLEIDKERANYHINNICDDIPEYKKIRVKPYIDIMVPEECMKYFYDIYLSKCKKILLENKKCSDRYIKKLKEVNNIDNLENLNLKTVEDIIRMTDKELRTEKEIIKINQNRIKEFIECHKDEFDQTVIPIDRLTKKMNSFVTGNEFLSENKIKKIFYKQIKEIGFEYEYKKFLNENLKEKEKKSKRFDKFELFERIKKSDEYKEYTGLKNIDFDNFWMGKYLRDYRKLL